MPKLNPAIARGLRAAGKGIRRITSFRGFSREETREAEGIINDFRFRGIEVKPRHVRKLFSLEEEDRNRIIEIAKGANSNPNDVYQLYRNEDLKPEWLEDLAKKGYSYAEIGAIAGMFDRSNVTYARGFPLLAEHGKQVKLDYLQEVLTEFRKQRRFTLSDFAALSIKDAIPPSFINKFHIGLRNLRDPEKIRAEDPQVKELDYEFLDECLEQRLRGLEPERYRELQEAWKGKKLGEIEEIKGAGTGKPPEVLALPIQGKLVRKYLKAGCQTADDFLRAHWLAQQVGEDDYEKWANLLKEKNIPLKAVGFLKYFHEHHDIPLEEVHRLKNLERIFNQNIEGKPTHNRELGKAFQAYAYSPEMEFEPSHYEHYPVFSKYMVSTQQKANKRYGQILENAFGIDATAAIYLAMKLGRPDSKMYDAAQAWNIIQETQKQAARQASHPEKKPRGPGSKTHNPK